MPPLTRRRAGAGEASIALRRDAYVGVGRRGSAGLRRARAAFDVRIHMYLHTTKNLARRAPSSRRRSRVNVAPTAFARDRGAAGQRVLPPGRLDDCWPQACGRLLPSGLPTVTQWSLPPAHVHGQNRPLSRVSLSVERAFLNSQRARVARHNPPRVIGKPGSLPSLCLLGGRVCVSWKRLRADSA